MLTKDIYEHRSFVYYKRKKQSLKKRFEVLIKDTSFFDCLVGYFYSSGFHAIYQSLKNTEKIRILIGISTSIQTFELLEKAKKPKQQQIDFSHAETKQEIVFLSPFDLKLYQTN